MHISFSVDINFALLFQLGNMSSGKQWCGLVLDMDQDNVDALCDRAELYISQQMYEEAIKDYQSAKEVENHPQKVQSLYVLALCALYLYLLVTKHCTGVSLLLL